jgi:hypothetical protein
MLLNRVPLFVLRVAQGKDTQLSAVPVDSHYVIIFFIFLDDLLTFDPLALCLSLLILFCLRLILNYDHQVQIILSQILILSLLFPFLCTICAVVKDK